MVFGKDQVYFLRTIKTREPFLMPPKRQSTSNKDTDDSPGTGSPNTAVACSIVSPEPKRNAERKEGKTWYVCHLELQFFRMYASKEEAETAVDDMCESFAGVDKKGFQVCETKNMQEAKKIFLNNVTKKRVNYSPPSSAVQVETPVPKKSKSVNIPTVENAAMAKAVNVNACIPSVDTQKISREFQAQSITFDVHIFRYPEAKYVLYMIEFLNNGRIFWGYKPDILEEVAEYDRKENILKGSDGGVFAKLMNHMKAASLRETSYGPNEVKKIQEKNGRYTIILKVLYGYATIESTDLEIKDMVKNFLENTKNPQFRELYHCVLINKTTSAKLAQTSDPKNGELWKKLELGILKLRTIRTQYLNYCFTDEQIDVFTAILFSETAGKARSMWPPEILNMVVGNPNKTKTSSVDDENFDVEKNVNEDQGGISGCNNAEMETS